MSLGSSLVMGALDSMYKPQVNPDVKQYDPNSGTYHDANGNVVPLYVTPTTTQRLFSPTAREYSALNAQSVAAPLIAQQQSRTVRKNWEDNVFPSSGNPQDTAYSQSILPPSVVNQNAKDIAYGATGTPGKVGSLLGSIDLNAAEKMKQDTLASLNRNPITIGTEDANAVNSYSKATGLDPLLIKDAILTQQGQLNRRPTEEEILSNLQAIRSAQAQSGVRTAPYESGTALNKAIGENILSTRFAPQPMYSNILHGDRMSLERDTALGASPAMLSMAGLSGLTDNPLTQGQNTTQLPSGITIQNAPVKQSVGPTLIANSAGNSPVGSQPVSEHLRAIDGVPNATINPYTKQVYVEGHNVTSSPEFQPIFQKGLEQLAQEEQDRKEATHNAKQAALKAELARVKAEHLNNNPIKLLAQPMEETAYGPVNTAYALAHLIGKKYDWLTQP